MREIQKKRNNLLSLLVVGLGNPGDQYSLNRHNVGFRVIDSVTEITGTRLKKPLFSNYLVGRVVKDHSALLYVVKPLVYMNRSGAVLPALLRKTGGGDILVICDQLDLPPGQCRLKMKGSSGGHRGLASVIEYLGTEDFMRLYVGIGRPKAGQSVPEYVLGDFSTGELEIIQKGIKNAAEGVLKLLESSPPQVMNEINKKIR